ncbi:MAG TPA: hypothetical protein PLQ76_00135 [bacterium]|nr:hypothetical protein [bacterium]
MKIKSKKGHPARASEHGAPRNPKQSFPETSRETGSIHARKPKGWNIMSIKKILGLTFSSVIITILISASAAANTTSFWKYSGINQFYRGKYNGTALTSDGRVAVGVKTDEVFTTTEPFLWTAAYDSKGALWLGSGNKAILFRLDAKAKTPEEAAVLDGVGVSAIAIDKKDNVYAAVFPGGDIYVLRPGKKAELFAKTYSGYVWDIKVGASGAVYCVTGNPASALKITTSGEVKTLYSGSSERHFLSMFLDNEKYIYTGTSPNGLVLRISISESEKAKPEKNDSATMTEEGTAADNTAASGETPLESIEAWPPMENESAEPKQDKRAVVLLDLEEDEAYRLLPWKDGRFFVAANRDQRPPAPQQPGAPKIFSRPDPLSFPLTPNTSAPDQMLQPARVYLVNRDGQARKFLDLPDQFVLSLADLGNGKVMVGTGNNGRIYILDVTAEEASLQEISSRQALAIVGSGAGLRIAAGNPGALYAPKNESAESGSFISLINDASTPAVYGNFDAVATVPAKSSLEFQTRTGNTPNPSDGTWSNWSAAEGKTPFKITSPPGRYIQFKALFKSTPDGASPMLREARIYYLTANQAPVLDSVTVAPSAASRKPTAPPASQASVSASAASAASQQNAASMGGPSSGIPVSGKMNPPMANPDANLIVGSVSVSDMLSIRWAASDPDQDPLTFALHFRRIPSETWSLIEDELSDNEYSWQTDSVPDGLYEIRVTASDENANTEDRAISTTAISDPFVIDRTRPTVTILDVKADKGSFEISGAVTDVGSTITAIEYSVDKLEWEIVFPEDGLLDSDSEKFSFKLKETGAGPHTLFVRARDAVGNTGVASKLFSK